jgi:hypothetical protein
MLGLSRRGRLVKQGSLFADQRGAVAFEMLIVFAFLILVLLLPLADMAIAGFQFISARQALRAFGQSILYTPPDDVADTSNWTVPDTTGSRYPIKNLYLSCGDSTPARNCPAPPSGTLTPPPYYYSYQTTVELKPMVLGSVLCTAGGSDGCTYTLSYSERFK